MSQQNHQSGYNGKNRRIPSVVYGFLCVVVALLCSMAAPKAWSQASSGQISGHVVDQTGAAIPGAEVTLTNQATGETREGKTGDSGDFVFPGVQPGAFTVTVELTGFKQYTKEGLVLSASERLSAGNIALEIGTVAEKVDVVAEHTPVQSESGERSALLDSHEISTMMSEGRDVTSLLRTLPGVVKPGEGGSQLGTQSAGTINGVRGDYSSISIDGTTGNTRGGPNLDTPLNMDAVGEVKVLTGNYQAEYGQSGGAIIELVTKAGTQHFHGTGYYYGRNEAFNANDYFNNQAGVARPQYRYNTVGYNIGGPLYIPKLFNTNKDKLFFFFSQEIWPTKAPGKLQHFMMPTALERQGNFSQSVDKSGKPVTYIADPAAIAAGKTCKKAGDSGCFAGNIISAGRISSDMQKLMNILPLPNTATAAYSGGQYNYIYQGVDHKPVNQQVLRVDYNISSKWKAYFRGMRMTNYTDGADVASVTGTMQWGTPFTYSTPGTNASFNLTYIPTANIVNEFNLGWAGWEEYSKFSNSTDLPKFQRNAIGFGLGQFNPQINSLNLVPRVTWGGSSGFAVNNTPSINFDNRFPLNDLTRSWQGSDSLTKVWNRHTSKAGFYLQLGKYVQHRQGATFNGQFDFATNTSNPNDTGYTYANSLLGDYNSYTEGTALTDYAPSWTVLEWYLQDSWKVTPKLTIEYGIRFTYDIPTTLKPGDGAGFVPSKYSAGSVAQLYQPYLDPKTKKRVAVINPAIGGPIGSATNPEQPAVYIGQFVPGTGSTAPGVVLNTDPGYPHSLRNSNGVLPAPRLGFAYDPMGTGDLVIRGGAGIFYNTREGGGTVGDYSLLNPIVNNPVQNYGDVRQFANKCSGTACSAGTTLLSPQQTRILQLNRSIESIYNATLGIQERIGFQTVADVAYVGTFGRHLSQERDLNIVPYLSHFQSANLDSTQPTPTVYLNGPGAPYAPVTQYIPLSDNFFRPTPGFTNVYLREYAGTSSYHALQAQLTRRFAHGLQFGVVWTWSKAMTDSDAVDGRVATYQPLRSWNYAEASYDRTNNFVAHWSWDVPNGSRLWHNPAMKALFDNWQYSGIAEFVSGQPMLTPATTTPSGAPSGTATFSTGGLDLTGGGDGTRAIVSGNPVLSKGNRTVKRFFDPSVFMLPQPGVVPGPNTPGLLGRNMGHEPGVNNFDMALNKNIRIRESVMFQLRGEAYNVFNHPSFTQVDNNLVFNAATGAQTSTTFGNVNKDQDPRILQLSGRISF